MIFKLRTSGNFYNAADAKKLKLSFGFAFERTEEHLEVFKDTPFYKLGRSSPKIEINTLEELMAFQKEWGNLIISEDTIEIYDEYRE